MYEVQPLLRFPESGETLCRLPEGVIYLDTPLTIEAGQCLEGAGIMETPFPGGVSYGTQLILRSGAYLTLKAPCTLRNLEILVADPVTQAVYVVSDEATANPDYVQAYGPRTAALGQAFPEILLDHVRIYSALPWEEAGNGGMVAAVTLFGIDQPCRVCLRRCHIETKGIAVFSGHPNVATSFQNATQRDIALEHSLIRMQPGPEEALDPNAPIIHGAPGIVYINESRVEMWDYTGGGRAIMANCVNMDNGLFRPTHTDRENSLVVMRSQMVLRPGVAHSENAFARVQTPCFVVMAGTNNLIGYTDLPAVYDAGGAVAYDWGQATGVHKGMGASDLVVGV